MNHPKRPASWIGARLLRKEDARHLHGHGMFIADIDMPGTQEIAFVRSQRAHANVRHVGKPAQSAGQVFTLADIGPINILEAGPELAAHALRAGLVDEVQMFVCPAVFGAGKRFFPDGVRLKLELVDEHRFRKGVVVLR